MRGSNQTYLIRIQQHAREWGVVVGDTFETESSVIAFGARDVDGSGRRDQEVVLKVVKQTGDEWHSGEVLAAFNGTGLVRVYEHAPGAVLLERLRPGNSLSELSLNGRDEEATNILADVIQQMSSVELSTSERESAKRASLPHCPTVHDWAKGFDRYLATGDDQIPNNLVAAAQRTYVDLCGSQRRPRLLHGDLQPYNVLFDSARAWLAIDPKGVVGEIEYEVGAVLRNPYEQPELFLSRSTIERRLQQFAKKLNLDFERALAWAFAQAVLSAIWSIEDGFAVDATNPALRLANVIRPMLLTFAIGRFTTEEPGVKRKMPEANATFAGSIPQNYDHYLGPILFEPYAADLASRLDISKDASVLELACGTGIVTRRLLDRLGPDARLLATDLNDSMLDYARARFGSGDTAEWKQADASDLPFADRSFDAAVCQFGLMFFPDKERAVRETYRVLKPGGTFLFNVWDAIEQNDLPHTAHEVVSEFFADNPPDFYNVPFSFHDPETIRSLLSTAGFDDIQLTLLPLEAIAVSATDAAKGLVHGNPIINAIRERDESKIPEIEAALASAIAARYGDAPVRARMQALICRARR